MNNSLMKKVFSTVGNFVQENSPAILTGFSVIGVISTAVIAARAHNNAQVELDEARRKKEAPLTKQEALELTWRHYVPPVLLGGATITCIFGLNSVHTKRQAAIASLYSLADNSFKEYRSKVVESIGARKEEKVRDDIVQDHLDKNPVSMTHIHDTPVGSTLCYDELSGRYFRSSEESIKRARNDFNHKLNTGMSIWLSVNDFYYELGLNPIELGDYMGWTVDELVEISTPAKRADNGDPCLVMRFNVKPRFLYNR